MSRRRPPLVIVSGAPAAGKSTLVRLLAPALGLPLITKDGIKELLGDSLGAPDEAASKRLGAATYEVLFGVAAWLLEGGAGLILESNFWHGASEARLAPLVARARSVLVHCEADPDVLVRRFDERREAGERHAVHVDTAASLRLREVIALGRFEPLALDVPLIRVRTDMGFDPPPEEVIVRVRAALGGP